MFVLVRAMNIVTVRHNYEHVWKDLRIIGSHSCIHYKFNKYPIEVSIYFAFEAYTIS